jgi:hypothetical protein
MAGGFRQAKREGANRRPKPRSLAGAMTMNAKSRTRLPALFALLLASLALTFTSGCIAVAAGAGATAVAWVKGELRTSVKGSFENSVAAANRAVQQLEFATVSESRDGLLAIIVARNAADKKIEIKIENAGGALSKVGIRVGVFGDEPVSLAILEKIKANL